MSKLVASNFVAPLYFLTVKYTIGSTFIHLTAFSNDAGETTAEGSDFNPLGDLASGSADIPTGASLLTLSLTYLQDMKVEDDEEIVYVLNSVDGPIGDMVVGTTATITCIITDDDDGIIAKSEHSFFLRNADIFFAFH